MPFILQTFHRHIVLHAGQRYKFAPSSRQNGFIAQKEEVHSSSSTPASGYICKERRRWLGSPKYLKKILSSRASVESENGNWLIDDIYFCPNLADRYPTLIASGRPHHVRAAKQPLAVQKRTCWKGHMRRTFKEKGKGWVRWDRQRACVVCMNLLDGPAGWPLGRTRIQSVGNSNGQVRPERRQVAGRGPPRAWPHDRSGLTPVPALAAPFGNSQPEIFFFRLAFAVVVFAREKARDWRHRWSNLLVSPSTLSGLLGPSVWSHICTTARVLTSLRVLFTQDGCRFSTPCVVTTTTTKIWLYRVSSNAVTRRGKRRAHFPEEKKKTDCMLELKERWFPGLKIE